MNKWTRRLELSSASAGPAAANASLTHHYFAFLSYSHADSADADWLHDELEGFRVPSSLAGRLTANGVIPKRLSPIFRDQHELAAGEDLTEEIRIALTASRCLIVLCSPAAAKSRWTNEEIEYFKRIHPDGCVIAAIVAGEPGRDGDECFPAALTRRYDRRGRPTGRRAEPLAADLRATGEGRRLGLLKIIAGILGVGLDDLVQRDHLRRQRRLAVISGGSFLGMLVATGLAVTAIQARDAARDQRREAESLIGFMLGDLKDKLEPIGKLDALDGVGSRVLSYYRNQDTSQLTDQALAQRSSALTLMGRIAQARGNLDSADKFIRAALAGTAESMRRAPDDPQRIFDHAQNVFWLAELARSRSQSDVADAAFREYKELADRLVAIDPNNIKWQTEKLYGEENLGIVDYNHRQFDQAIRNFEDALGSLRALASIGSGNFNERQSELANALSWVAEAERARGHLDAAIAARQQQLDLLNRLLSNPSADVDSRRQAAIAHMALGILLNERNGPTRGQSELNAAISQADILMAIEPDNAIWKMTASMTRLYSARALLAAGNAGEAKSQWAAGCRFAAGLRTSGAAMNAARAVQTDCMSLEAQLELADGETKAAVASAQRALVSAKSEHKEDPVIVRYRIAAAYMLLGDAYQKAGNSEAAKASWNDGLSQIPEDVRERPSEMNTRAELLRKVGRVQEAQTLSARLRSIGYRGGT
jgi:tetratricopeptide (TPR) repeat protein